MIPNLPAACIAVDEGLWRCERRANSDDPFAIVYVDTRDRLPETPDALLSLEEKYLAKPFFAGPKYLKWNHYWLFVVPDAKWNEAGVSEARNWIERDTTYAKKVVVAQKDLRGFFLDKKWDVSKRAALEAPREVWLRALAPLKLDRLLFSRSRSPSTRMWVRGGEVHAELPSSPAEAPANLKNEDKFVSEIKWC